MENENAFKNFINKTVVNNIANEILIFYPQFNKKAFVKVETQFAHLELKARVLAVANALKENLPQDYPKALAILLKVIKNKKLSGFTLWPFSEFISQNGLDHFDESLNAMYYLTIEFTSEFAVRAFFIKDHKKVLKSFHKWATDKNVHVRRFVSEGSRPLLPWGLRLQIFKNQPELTVELLEYLKYDEELYVRKSVANHLNDIAKFKPALVIATLKNWQKNGPKQHTEKINWITKHALRTLIKKGNPDALKLMGVTGKADADIKNFKLTKAKYSNKDPLVFDFVIQSKSNKNQNIILDYVVYFLKSNGQHSPKVFKLKTFTLMPKQSLVITKKHNLRPITTMKYYKGIHHVSLKINGKELSKLQWDFS